MAGVRVTALPPGEPSELAAALSCSEVSPGDWTLLLAGCRAPSASSGLPQFCPGSSQGMRP